MSRKMDKEKLRQKSKENLKQAESKSADSKSFKSRVKTFMQTVEDKQTGKVGQKKATKVVKKTNLKNSVKDDEKKLISKTNEVRKFSKLIPSSSKTCLKGVRAVSILSRAEKRGLIKSAMSFWAYVFPLIPGHSPLQLTKLSYTFGTSKITDYRISKEAFQNTSSEANLRLKMFRVYQKTQKDGFYKVMLQKKFKVFVDNREVHQSDFNLQGVHEISFAKNAPAAFLIAVCPNHDYSLRVVDDDIHYQVTGRRRDRSRSEHFLNTHIIDKALRTEQDRFTNIGFSFVAMQPACIHVADLKHSGLEDLHESIWLQKSHQHPSLVEIFHYQVSLETMFLSCKLYPGGNLKTCGQLMDLDAKIYFFQIFSALNHLQKSGITFADVIPEHILFLSHQRPSKVVLSCSLFAFQAKKSFNSIYSLLSYHPPELVTAVDCKKSVLLDHKVDVWSAGLCMYEALCGQLPFTRPLDIKCQAQVFNEQPNLKLQCPYWSKVSSETRNLLERILVINPESRPSADVIMNDEVFTNEEVKSKVALVMDGDMV